MFKFVDFELLRVIAETYSKKATIYERLIDNFLLFVCLVLVLIILNFFINGPFPFNAFLGAVYCCLGMFATTLALRIRVSYAEKQMKQTGNKSDIQKKVMKRIFFEYVCAVVIMNILCISYMP
jgi:hypothetical protein